MKRIKELKDLVQEAIDNGATTVEQIHKSLANMPFEVLEKINLGGATVDKLENFQKETIGTVYDFIRSVNTKAGDIANELLRKLDLDQGREEVASADVGQCKALTKSGNRCKRKAVAGSVYCSVHNPK